jgi:MGT family glycosyltransferase
MHFGIVSPPVSGHLNPFFALATELISRGHRVTMFHVPDVAERLNVPGLEFIAIGQTTHAPGTLTRSLARIAELHGIAALRFTLREVRGTTEMFLRDGPEAIRRAGVEALLVDQTEGAGGTIAEHLGIPSITVCNALLLNYEISVPPPFTAWSYSTAPWALLRNRVGYAMSDRVLRPVLKLVHRYRAEWNLPTLNNPYDSPSARLHLSQQVSEFDFPRSTLPATFHYVGPLRIPSSAHFPWDRLNGRSLVYASLGTLQNQKIETFRLFAEACNRFSVQLIIAGLDPVKAVNFPGNPIVVAYAPQQLVLQRAALTLTHAGLNTALDSLAAGVPLVAIPITYEQPAIASRIVYAGAGVTIPFARLTLDRLTNAIGEVLQNDKYKENARRVQQSIKLAGGVKRAAELIETALGPDPAPALSTSHPLPSGTEALNARSHRRKK